MPKFDTNPIIHAIKMARNGVSISELLELEGINLPRRTLQRRLDSLVKDGSILPVGGGRSRRYITGSESEITQTDPPNRGIKYDFSRPPVGLLEEPNISSTNWLGQEAMALKNAITRPLAQRTPVGYQRNFLASYEPNVTFYLPEETRSHLAGIGEVGIANLPAGTYFRRVLDRLLIDLTWNSSRLEGNTYSLLETEKLLKAGKGAKGKEWMETQMILNHKAAIEMLADRAEQVGFNHYTLCSLHALLADNLLENQTSCGRLRDAQVGISGSVFHPLNVPQQIDEFFAMILRKADAIEDPFEASFFAMVHLPYLQPFEDVNKRTSRLAANIPFIQKNLCPLSFVDVEAADYLGGMLAVYELNDTAYLHDVFVHSYEQSTKNYQLVRAEIGDPDPFRMIYRRELKSCVQEVVQAVTDDARARAIIDKHTEAGVQPADRLHFNRTVQQELDALHMGNIARFQLRPSEFEAWQGRPHSSE